MYMEMLKLLAKKKLKQTRKSLKLKEGKKSVLEGVPKSLPALVKATRIQEKVKGVGFEWDEISDVWAKVYEELNEFKKEVEVQSKQTADEFGDLIFSLINLARYLNIEPENALELTNQKFIKRFQLMEKMIDEEKKDISKLNLENLDKYWDKAKIIIQKY